MRTVAPTSLPLGGAMSLWGRHLSALAIAAAILLLLFARDAAHMAGIWWTSSTFNHCLLIVPIIAWLVWQRVPAVSSLEPRIWPTGLVLVGAGAMSWLVGDAAGVSLFRHGGLIVILQGAVATLLGRAVAGALLFPLFYMLFLVPVGEELVPALQGVTARISMALLALAGIPAHLEGIFITTPGGYFEVAEACSGVKFLVAMFALGVLIAHLCFKSWKRRMLFMAAAVAVPVFANGVRAFATIYVAGRTSSESAAGFDHIVYGWFFFAVVIAALLAGSWRFFDRSATEPFIVRPSAPADAPGASVALMLALVLTLAAAPLLWSSQVSASARGASVPDLAAPEVQGWRKVARDGNWSPRFAGADRLLVQRYRDAAGHEVDLAIALYAWQAEGRELVGYGQGAVVPESGWSWSRAAGPPRGGRADLIVRGGVTREVLSFYRVGDLTTGNQAAVKLATLKARLLGGRQAGAAILVSGEASPGPARPVLDRFVAALGPIETVFSRVIGS